MPLALAALFAIGVTMTAASAAHGQTAPQGLRGKSIIISWTENRSQRQLGQANFRDVVDPLSRKIYFGTTGRPFNRFATSSRGREAAREGVGATGRTFGGGSFEFQFAGRAMSATSSSKGGLARRFTVTFNESFSTCEAEVVFAKQAGSDIVVGRNLYTGQPQEIRSATVSDVTCSLRDGNVFAQ